VFKDLSLWAREAKLPSGGSFLLLFSAIFLIGMSLLLVVGVLRGLPRLTIDTVGVKLETVLGTRWAHWASLGPFVLTTEEIGRFKRRLLSARADIIGTAASRNVRRSKKLIISDAFVTPIDAIVVDLQSQSAQATGIPSRLTPPGVAERIGQEFGVADFKIPWLTFIILGILAAVFGVEQIFAIDGVGPLLRPSTGSLFAFGGLNPAAVLSHGEWYRLFTAPLLHADLNHLILNGIAVLMAGYLLERLVGRRWFMAFFVIGAVGRTLMALMLDPSNVVSVGASGAIMGLFAACFIGSFRLTVETRARSRMQVRSVQILIPSLPPLWTTAAVGRIDYAAHIGGALSCAVVMVFLLKTWPDTARLPRFGRLAAGVIATGLILCPASAVAVATHYPTPHLVGARMASIAANRYRSPPAAPLSSQLTEPSRGWLRTVVFGEVSRSARSKLTTESPTLLKS
jgi:membrane associated rhomboid family serine protease